jgi:hypothetical protein
VYSFGGYNCILMLPTFLFSLLLLASTARADLGQNPNTTPVPAKVADAVRARPFVMIAGIMNETIPGYFADNAKTIRKDFKQEEVRRFFPSSKVAVDENAPRINAWIRKTWLDFGKKPVIVLAHSKGANETLLAILKDSSLLRDGIVDRLVFIQAALGGSHIADLLLNDDSGSWPAAQPFHWLFHDWKGLWSMTPARARTMFADAIAAADPADRVLLSEKLFYVRASKVRSKCSWELQAMHLFVESFWGESDGVMLPEDQKIDGLGTDLGLLEGDHFDLTEKGPGVVSTPASFRRAFTRALMRELFE